MVNMFLASSGFFGATYGGSIGNMLAAWEQAGFFSYILPFLLIFALVFGILTRTQIFKDNKAINGVIALVVGLLALQFNFVPVFFSEIFPRLGVALSVILVFIILVGLFLDPKSKYISWILFVVGLIVFFVVLVQTAGWMGWSSAYFLQANWEAIVGALVVIIILVAIFNSVGPKKPLPELRGIWARDFKED